MTVYSSPVFDMAVNRSAAGKVRAAQNTRGLFP
jgi:hypothetical protein